MRFLFFLLLFVTLFAGCRKDPDKRTGFSCSELSKAVAENDLQKVKQVVESITAGLIAIHNMEAGREQLDALAAFLGECPMVDSYTICFECIQTLPPQSEILVKVTYGGNTVEKVLDLQRDNTGRLRVVNMHD